MTNWKDNLDDSQKSALASSVSVQSCVEDWVNLRYVLNEAIELLEKSNSRLLDEFSQQRSRCSFACLEDFREHIDRVLHLRDCMNAAYRFVEPNCSTYDNAFPEPEMPF